MFNKIIRFSSHRGRNECIKLLLSVVFLGLAGPVKFNVSGEIPITLQSLAVLVVAIWFGWQTGVTAIGIYIFCGAIGFPVFAGYDSGVEKLIGPTGGFFLGFILAAFIIGHLSSQTIFQKPLFNLVLWILGHLIIMVTGIIWISFFTDWLQMIKNILPGAVLKILTGWILTQLLLQFCKKETAS